VRILQSWSQNVRLLGSSNKVNMVRHQTMANQFYLVTLCAPAQQVEVNFAVSIALEDKTPCIPPLRNVMRDPESDHTSKTRPQRPINVRDRARKERLRRALSGRPVRIMLHCSDKFSPVRKVNEVSSCHSTGILGAHEDRRKPQSIPSRCASSRELGLKTKGVVPSPKLLRPRNYS
jgi:hypothetical protein